MHQEVFLLNPKYVKQSVATGVISGLGGQHKFYFIPIPESRYKVDVTEQSKVKDVVNSCFLWEGKFIKPAPLKT